MKPDIITEVQAKNHMDQLSVKAERPDMEAVTEDNAQTQGIGNERGLGYGADGSNAKQHPALNSNQFAGINPDGKAAAPSEMTQDEIADSALKARQNTPELTLSKEFTNTYTPEAAPKSAPSAKPAGH